MHPFLPILAQADVPINTPVTAEPMSESRNKAALPTSSCETRLRSGADFSEY